MSHNLSFVDSNCADPKIGAHARQSNPFGVIVALRAGPRWSTLQALSEPTDLRAATISQLTKLDTSIVNVETVTRLRRGRAGCERDRTLRTESGFTSIILLGTPSNDDQGIVRQRSLQCESIRGRGIHPDIDFSLRAEDHRHGLWMIGADQGVRLCREKGKDVVGRLTLLYLLLAAVRIRA
jgi:hypothetical protein